MDRRTYKINRRFHFLASIMLATDIIAIIVIIVLLFLGIGSVTEWISWLLILTFSMPSTIRLLRKTKPSDNDGQGHI